MEDGSIGRTDLISPVDFSESVLRRSECQAFLEKTFLHISLIRRISYLDIHHTN